HELAADHVMLHGFARQHNEFVELCVLPLPDGIGLVGPALLAELPHGASCLALEPEDFGEREPPILRELAATRAAAPRARQHRRADLLTASVAGRELVCREARGVADACPTHGAGFSKQKQPARMWVGTP